jgi:ATP-dependent exoDNAse (exonuclease V) beta subunit
MRWFSGMLQFNEEAHIYSVGDKILISVTQIVESQFRPFNARVVAAQLEKTQAYDPKSEYFQMDRYEIESHWKRIGRESREKGTQLHKAIECFYQHGHAPQEPSIEWDQFTRFHNDHPDWFMIASEHRVHNGYAAGTIDAIFDTPEGIVLVDWKRSKAIDYAGYGQGRNMMKHAADCNYNKYSLQLSLYKQLIRVEIAAMYIIQMHPDIENYRKIRAHDFAAEAEILLSGQF